MRKPKVKKPYKSLKDIYLKESFAKPVPLLPRQTVLNEQPGMAEILIQKDPGEQLPVYKVSNKLADQILKAIYRSQGADNEGVDSIIASCLEIDGWAPKNKGQDSAVFHSVVRAFETADLNYDNFKNLLALQTDKDNPIRTKLLKDLKVHSLNDLVSDKFKSLFKTPESAYEVLRLLWGILPQSQVNVGPGELALTMLSDAKKGLEGDLQFDFGLVEVKGNGAALGSGKIANSETYTELNKLLATYAGNISIQSSNVVKQREIIKKALSDLKMIYSANKKPANRKLKTDKFYTPDPETLEKIKTEISNMLKALENTNSLINLINKSNLLDETKADLLKRAQLLQRIEKGEVLSTKGGTMSKFAPAVTAFFSQNLDPEVIIKGTRYLRSSSNTNQDEIEKVAGELLVDNPNLLKIAAGIGVQTSPLYRFIGAIHVAEYYQEKQFTYIVFFNSDAEDKTKLPTKIVALYFKPGSSFIENVKMVFNFFNSEDVNVKISLGVDNQRGTVRVELG